MASKSLLVVLVVLSFISSILPLEGQDLLKHSHAEYKVEVGDLHSRELQSNNSAGSTTPGLGYLIDDYDYRHFASYLTQGHYHDTWWNGLRAKMTVWKIQDVQPQSVSSVYIAASNTYNGSEMIAAGVHVYPQMYKNRDVRFFTYWRSAKENIQVKECYNTYCPGFVIANGSNLLPGQALASLPKFGEPAKHITLRIKKDLRTGDWSLYREDMGGPIGGMTLLGWWPQNLFRNLSSWVNIIQWSGEVAYQRTELGPAMGNEHFPGEQGGTAASFNDCYGFDHDGTIYTDPLKTYPYIDRPQCYGMSPWYEKVANLDINTSIMVDPAVATSKREAMYVADLQM